MDGLGTEKKPNVNIHYVTSGVSCVAEEDFEECYLHHSDLHLAEMLQDQETLYRSLQTVPSNLLDLSQSDSQPHHEHDQVDRKSEVGDPSESQLALDEAVARSLQELEHLSLSSLNGVTATRTQITASTSAGASAQTAEQDGIDPDNMTYEELQSLGDTIGTESKGLSDELISFLPSSTYKKGLFSNKDKHDCVICCMPYKKRELIVTLPCQHHYHSNCITRWLKENKACPVCMVEVFGS